MTQPYQPPNVAKCQGGVNATCANPPALPPPRPGCETPKPKAQKDAGNGGPTWDFVNTMFNASYDIADGFMNWLLQEPRITVEQVRVAHGSCGPVLSTDAATRVDKLEHFTAAIAYALLGLVFTLSVVNLTVGSMLSGQGGASAVRGVAEGTLAAMAILAWPTVFAQLTSITDAVTSTFITQQDLGRFGEFLGSAGIAFAALAALLSPVVAAIVAIIGLLLLLSLIAMKLLLYTTMVLLFVSMPLVIVVSRLPGCGWVGQLGSRTFVVALLWPVAWALCFAAAKAIGMDGWGGQASDAQPGLLDQAVVQPITAIMLLAVCVSLPSKMTKVALYGSGAQTGGSGFLGHLASYMGIRHVAGKLGGGAGGAGNAGQGAGAAAGGGSAAGGAPLAPPPTPPSTPPPGAGRTSSHGGSFAPGPAAAGPRPSEGAPDGRTAEASMGGDGSTAAGSRDGASTDHVAGDSASASDASSAHSLRALSDAEKRWFDQMHDARHEHPASADDVEQAFRQLGDPRYAEQFAGLASDPALRTSEGNPSIGWGASIGFEQATQELRAAEDAYNSGAIDRHEYADRSDRAVAQQDAFMAIGSARLPDFEAGLQAFRDSVGSGSFTAPPGR